MTPITIADFVESHADLISVQQRQFEISNNAQRLLTLLLSSLLLSTKELVAGPSDSPYTTQGKTYLLDKEEMALGSSIFISPKDAPHEKLLVPISEFINTFAHCQIAVDTDEKTQTA